MSSCIYLSDIVSFNIYSDTVCLYIYLGHWLHIYLEVQNHNNLTCIAEANIGYFVDPVQ